MDKEHPQARSTKSALPLVIVAIAGLALGATAALLWGRGLKPEWVEATGTWFGAVGTVLALLWAVREFRADQAARASEDLRARKELGEREVAAEEAVKDKAALVVVTLKGGAGQGNTGRKDMTSVTVEIDNRTDSTVDLLSLDLLSPLVAKGSPSVPRRLRPEQVEQIPIVVKLVGVRDDELSGTVLDRFRATASYRLNGRTWVRTTGEQPSERP